MNVNITYHDSIKIVFYDMDHTLIASDCDVTWKKYLVSHRQAPWYANLLGKWYYYQYRLGRLNLDSFFRFQLAEFVGHDKRQMQSALKEHFIEYIIPSIYPAVPDILATAKNQGLQNVLITATVEEIAAPLAEYLAMDGLLASQQQEENGVYSGVIRQPYCGGSGKLHYMAQYLAQRQDLSLKNCAYWGDNVTDVPVLEQVGYPIACNPSSALLTQAEENNWKIIHLEK